MMFRLILTAATAVSILVAGQPSTVPSFEDEIIDVSSEFLVGDKQLPHLSNLVQCPLTLGCCEEDCCGENTSWQSGFCIVNPDSSGFTGTHSSGWKEGCVERVCCESDCCGPETVYDESNAVCIPQGNVKRSPSKVGDSCTGGEECDTGYCYRARGVQFCSCNPETAAGCSGEEICASSEDLIFAQGVADVPPSCFLPIGTTCDPAENKCLSTNCDNITLRCACNTFSNWPCDTEIGEVCVPDENKGYVCQLENTPSLCPLPASGTVCTKELRPVVCGDCEYDNQCLATAANPDFTSDTCAGAGELACPVSNGICPEIYAPVVCGDCEYSNQCEASAADAEFTSDTCVKKAIPIEPNPTVPAGGMDGECKGNEDCESGYCYLIVGSGNPGTCSCNPATNMGCDNDYECVGSKQLTEARGTTFVDETRPECRLPYGAACSTDDPKACLTGVCDDQTESCACNRVTNYPCDIESGEKCNLLDGSSVCSNDPLGGEGLFKVGEPCTAGEQCDTGYCYRTRGAQFCSCNPETAAGCSGEEVCASSEDLIFAQGVADVPPSCFLPVGAKCDPNDRTCISTNCDKITLRCACNTFSNWPCDTEMGEVCVLDENKGYICQRKDLCPEPTGICTEEYAPVVCGDCEYSNQCWANSAGFSPETCKPKDLCPEPTGACTFEYAPVVCGDCEYSNQCQANSAGFTPETCKPKAPCPEPTGVCTAEYAPVVCGDCEYSNQCWANSAGFTPETCKPFATDPPEVECNNNEDCESGYCYLGLGSPGTCSCNPETNIGCPQDYNCAGSGELYEAQGIVFFVEPKPECFLPFGAACSPSDPEACLTGVCDFETESCACNFKTHYPCDTRGGETCVFLNKSYVCSNDPLGGDGPFEINEPCIVNDDCVTGYCFYGFQIPGSPGTCSCNPDTNAGCSGEEECASSEDLMEAQFLADAPAGCYLPDGATCDPTTSSCLSGVCDEKTLKCVCSTFSNYPCDTASGEVCVLDESNNYVCQLPTNLCPKPLPGAAVCTKIYRPVVCGDCQYDNQCLATAANSTFTPDTCT